MYSVLLMEGRWNGWNPWYLMPKDKPRKVECKFCGDVILYHKDIMLFHLGYQYDGNGQARVAVCLKGHPRMKALFARCVGLVPPPPNDMEVPAHISAGRIEDVAIETSNPSMEKKNVSTSQVEGAKNFTPLQTTKRVLTNPQITTLEPFDMFHCPKD